MARKRLHRLVYVGINRAMTRDFDRWSKRTYGISGKRLLAKVAAAEGGGTTQRPNVSYAGARGPFQFIPSTRAAYKKRYGLDAWRTNTEAAKAAMIHLKGTGIRGYNPGMGSYQRLVLGQDVDTGPLRTGRYGSGRVRGGGGGGPVDVRVRGRGPTVSRDPVTPGGTGMVELLKEMQEASKPPLPQGTLTPPAFAAQAVMPKMFAQPESTSPPPEEQPSISELLEKVQAGGGIPRTKVEPGQVTGVSVRGGGEGGGGGGRIPRGGKLIGRPQDRPGAPTNRHVLELTRRASAWGRVPIRLGTGSAHSRFSVSGNESDHWRGNGLDLPARGRYGDRIAGAILVQLGVPRRRARRMAQRGGAYTIRRRGRRWQIIWKTSAGSPYGDHTDHVHIGMGR